MSDTLATAPSHIIAGDMHRGVIPLLSLQLAALMLLFLHPGIATWLPKAIGR